MKRTTRPARGVVRTGAVFDPSAPETTAVGVLPGTPNDRAMPMPQSPLATAEVERLKARAAKSRSAPGVVGQPDPGDKPRRKP